MSIIYIIIRVLLLSFGRTVELLTVKSVTQRSTSHNRLDVMITWEAPDGANYCVLNPEFKANDTILKNQIELWSSSFPILPSYGTILQ